VTEGGEGPGWALLQEELSARGTILIQGHLDHRLATRAAAQLMERDAVSDAPARVHLFTSSGEFGAALTVMDTITALGIATEVTAVGAVLGPGLGVLAVAGHRVATLNCRLAFAAPRLQMEGDPAELTRLLEAELRDQQRWVEQVARATGRPFELVGVDLASALALAPEAARRYRLIDKVVGSSGSGGGSVR
jgi:ATP-dependent Clp protease protease subunit